MERESDKRIKGFLRWKDFALRRMEAGEFDEAAAAMRLKKEETLEHLKDLPKSSLRFEEMADILIESVEDSAKAKHSPAQALKQLEERERARMEADVLLLKIGRLERHDEEFFKTIPKHEDAMKRAFPHNWGERIQKRLKVV